MPIYEYKCKCGNAFEKLMKMNADTPACPKCKEPGPTKVVSQSSFALKGSGWEKDGYSKPTEESK